MSNVNKDGYYQAELPAPEPEKGGHWRLTVEQPMVGDNVFVAEELFRSASKHAERIEGTTLTLTSEDVRWLHARLGELIEGERLLPQGE